MGKSYVPEGFRSVNPYLIVAGGRELIEFLEHVFDARQMHCETNDDGSIANAALRIGDSVVEISDARPEWPPLTAGLHIFVPDCDEAYRRAIAQGATSLHEPTDMPYGERGAGVTDPLGNQWYIATHLTGRYETGG